MSAGPAGDRDTFRRSNSRLDSIIAALTSARAGSGGLILSPAIAVSGKPHSHRPFQQQPGNGHDGRMGRDPPGIRLPLMWNWIQILRKLGDEFGPPGRNSVRRVAPGVIDALVPEWATATTLVRAFGPPPPGSPSLRAWWPPSRTVHDSPAVADSRRSASRRPPVRQRASVLSTQLARLPIQVIANWTYFGSGRPVNRNTFERLVRSESARSIHLDGIGSDAAATLVDALAGTAAEDDVSQYVWSRTNGNPLYIRELMSVLVAHNRVHDVSDGPIDDVSEAVAGMVGQRLGRLDRPSRRALGAAAVIGPEFDIADLADVVDLPVSTVQARLRPAYETGLLDEVAHRPGCYRFGHGLLHDAVLANVPGSERAAVHAAIASNNAVAITTAAYEDVISIADHAWRAGTELNPETARRSTKSRSSGPSPARLTMTSPLSPNMRWRCAADRRRNLNRCNGRPVCGCIWPARTRFLTARTARPPPQRPTRVRHRRTRQRPALPRRCRHAVLHAVCPRPSRRSTSPGKWTRRSVRRLQRSRYRPTESFRPGHAAHPARRTELRSRSPEP